ncbi:MAG: winged helix-turn-helix domain-containing protein [Candidatus Micrarchaeota archaeon]|nr:winged helix-turn-helix domain-containing protein [Candidatus Micrarchaeota archaeon]
MRRLFLKTKSCMILMLLKDSAKQWYPSNLAREAGASYVHTVNLLARLRQNGIVDVERKGRQNIYRLSEKGAYLASALDDFAKKCDAYEQEAKAKAQQEAAAGSPQESAQPR